MVLDAARIVRVTENKVRETNAAPYSPSREARETGTAEGKGTTGDIGLGVVVTADFQLEAKFHGVLAANKRDVRAEIPLRVAVGDETLALRAHDVVSKVKHAWRRRRPRTRGNGSVVLRRPVDRRQVEAGVLGRTIISKPAEAGGYTDDGRRCQRIVVADSRSAAVVLFRAAIRAKAGA